MEINGKTLDGFLKREDDRALFGLMPLAGAVQHESGNGTE